MPDRNTTNDEDHSPHFDEVHRREWHAKNQLPRRSRFAPRRALPVGLLLGMLLLLGCGGFDNFDGTDASRGELGVAKFYWQEDFLGCLFGCNAKAPIATGSSAGLQVENAESLPSFTVRVDDPTVASVSGTSKIRVDALRAGEVRIILEEVDGGALIDEFVVTVADVDRIKAGDALLIAVGGSVEIGPLMFDDMNKRLVGLGALTYLPSPSLDQGQLDLTTDCGTFLVTQYEECVILTARNVGEGFLEIEAASGATQNLPLDLVIASTVVTNIRLQSEKYDNRILVRTKAFASGTRVYGARCAWTLTPSNSSLYISDIYDDGSVLIRSSSTGSSGTLTCDIGSASRSISLRL